MSTQPCTAPSYVCYSRKGVRTDFVLMWRLAMRFIHGMLRATLLFYLILQNDLDDMRFKMNPCDLCAANQNMNGGQCTHRNTYGMWMTWKWKCHIRMRLWHLVYLTSHRSWVATIETNSRSREAKFFEYLGMDIDFKSWPEGVASGGGDGEPISSQYSLVIVHVSES